jgi:galactose mutarotase-like enzyme
MSSPAGPVRRGSYKGEEALVLENDSLRVVILPSRGAKTASLLHKASGIETLWQNQSPRYISSAYGDPFDKGELAGFDEMFPTISRCYYEREPWAGAEIPDHGEVWSIPWEPTISGDVVTLSVRGTRLPYRLQKTVSLQGEKMTARYNAENLSDSPMDFIWAAHPLFNTAQGMRVIVPAGMRTVINSVPGATLGGYGTRLAFPGKDPRLDLVPARNSTGFQKYWFSEKVTEGWCVLHEPASALSIGLSFPADRVPWLGIWLNEGGYAGQYNIAPEPATGAMDRMDFSRMWNMHSVLGPRECYEWSLTITVGRGSEPCGMDPEGNFLRAR